MSGVPCDACPTSINSGMLTPYTDRIIIQEADCATGHSRESARKRERARSGQFAVECVRARKDKGSRPTRRIDQGSARLDLTYLSSFFPQRAGGISSQAIPAGFGLSAADRF